MAPSAFAGVAHALVVVVVLAVARSRDAAARAKSRGHLLRHDQAIALLIFELCSVPSRLVATLRRRVRTGAACGP